MNPHERFLQRVMNGSEANFFVGSGFAKFEVKNVGGELSLVAKTILGESIAPAPISDPNKVFEMFRELEFQRVQAGFKDGMIYGQSGNVFSKIPGVQQVSRGLINFRRKGIQRNQQLHNLSMQGYEVKEFVFDPQVHKGIESIEKLIFGGRTGGISVDKLADEIKGALVPTGSGGMRIIQITGKGATGPMSFRETMNLLGLDPFSVEAEGRMQDPTDILGKLGKRLRGHFQSKGISIETGRDSKLKAAVFDPKSLFGNEYEAVRMQVADDLGFGTDARMMSAAQSNQVDDVIKQMFDGQIINVNPENLQNLARQNNQKYLGDIGLSGADLKSAQAQSDRQLRLLESAGVGNARIENAAIVDINDANRELTAADFDAKYHTKTGGGTQIKGNMNFVMLSDTEINKLANNTSIPVRDRVMAKAIQKARAQGIDFLAPLTGLTSEMGGIQTDAKGTLVHVAAQKEAEVARLNRQTLRAQKEFYSDTDEIIKYARYNVEIALNELKNGNIHEDVLNYLRNQANMHVEDAYDYRDLSRSQVTARQRAIDEAADIVGFVDADQSGQAILRDPAMRSRVERAVRDYYYGTDINNPKFIIPNAMAGHISTDAFTDVQSKKVAVNKRLGKIQEGFMAYDPETKQFVLPTVNAAKLSTYLRILGGADLDDTINASLFFMDNDDSFRIVSAIFRNPTARGEGLLLEMRADDAFVTKKLKELSSFHASAYGTDEAREAKAFFEGWEDLQKRKIELEKSINTFRNNINNNINNSKKVKRNQDLLDKAQREINKIDADFEMNARRVLRNGQQAFKVATQNASGEVIEHLSGETASSYRMMDVSVQSKTVNYFRSTRDAVDAMLGLSDVDGKVPLHLGQAINFSDFMESLLDDTQDFSRVMQNHGFNPSRIALYGREALIDFYQKFGGSGSQVEATLNAAMEAVADSLAKAYNAGNIGKEAGVLLPFTSLYNLGGEGDDKYAIPKRFIDIANERLAQEGVTLQELVGNLDDDTTELGRYMQAAREGIDLTDSQIRNMEAMFDKQGLNSYVSATNTEDFEKAARSVIQEYNDQKGIYKNLDAGTELDVAKRVANDNVLQRALYEAQALSDRLGIGAVAALDEILMNVRSLADGKELRGMTNDLASDRSARGGVSNMLRNVAARRSLIDQQLNVLSIVADAGGKEVTLADANRLTDEEIARQLDILNAQRLTEEEIRRGVPGLERLETRSAVDNVLSRIPGSKTIKEGAKALWHRDVFRKGFYGVAAVAAASAIYQGSKDVAPEQMQGPEFLPGGSAYEGYMQSSVDYPTFNGFRSQAGTTYSIQTNGQYDPAMVAAAAEAITGANATGMVSYRQPVFADTNRAISNGF